MKYVFLLSSHIKFSQLSFLWQSSPQLQAFFFFLRNKEQQNSETCIDIVLMHTKLSRDYENNHKWSHINNVKLKVNYWRKKLAN